MSSASPPARDVFGLLLLDKSAGQSSNKALQRVKRLFRAAKAGHAGSLDPLATGMLPIFFGAATRLAAFMLEARKCYRVEATLGAATSTGDAEGAIIEQRLHETPPDAVQLATAVRAFVGEIEQVPPMYSALKREGVPLYRLARAGVEVERAPRRVVIESIDLERYEWPTLVFRVRCSKGTYVRTLVEDVAKAAGTLGHVSALRRLAVDPFAEPGMHTFEALEAAASRGWEALDEALLPAESALTAWPSLRLAAGEAARLAQGQTVPADETLPPGYVKVYGPSGGLIAIGRVTEGHRLAPARVFIR